jgi:hypothetical protein
MLFVKLPELSDLTTRHGPENELVIWGIFDELIDFWYCALAIPVSQPLQKISSDMITRVPASPTGTPMWGHETGTEADPICREGGNGGEKNSLRTQLPNSK